MRAKNTHVFVVATLDEVACMSLIHVLTRSTLLLQWGSIDIDQTLGDVWLWWIGGMIR
jgi:hypothetical protein